MPADLVLIAALDSNRLIGRDNALPWHLPEDLKRFKALTLGHAVLMGRLTFESIFAMLGKPLPGRQSIVLSRGTMALPEGCLLARSVDEARALAPQDKPLYVIGGAQVYAATLPLASRLALTEIHAAHEGDAWFPEFDRAQWREAARVPGTSTAGLRYDFVDYERTR